MKSALILICSFLFMACQSKQIKNAMNVKSVTQESAPEAIANYSSYKPNINEWHCDEATFSFTGDQLIFWCSLPGLLNQKQVFIKDLNSNEIKQITFLNGRINKPQIVKQDLVVFSSDTDKKKEVLTFNSEELLGENLFELYLYDLKTDEMTRLTENETYEGQATYIKHIDPKIIYLKKTDKTEQLLLKNLTNKSEKLLYSTSKKILELNTNHSNQILVVEEGTDKKLLNIFRNETEKPTPQEFSNNKFNFLYVADSNHLEFLEKQSDKTVLKSFSLNEKCERELFNFPAKTITHISKSPLDPQTYVWVEENTGFKTIKMGTLALNTSSACKKLAKRGKSRKSLLQ